MFKLDDELIKDRFSATSYSFFTDQEIKKLSVKQILNPTAFDHLGNPNDKGIYDKALGVSPFDHRSSCVTCGLDCNFCPGHVGHIELTAPIFNPFLINHLYRLLKSKCLSCHRIRINPKKIDTYVMSLKLIKSGQIVGSTTLKNYFMSAAKEIQLVSDNQLTDSKKLQNLRTFLDRVIEDPENKEEGHVELDNATYFRKLDKKFSKMKKGHEKEIIKMFKSYTENIEKTEDTEQPISTTIMSKILKETIHEIWGQVVSIQCPHCNAKSPGIRKDGYTKFFQKPLSEKLKNAMKQQERLGKTPVKHADQVPRDDAFEIITEASTAGNIHSRKESNTDHGHDEYSQLGNEFDDEFEEEDEGAELSNKQTYMYPLAIKDHIEKLWAKEKDLLDLIFGKYCPTQDGSAFESDSLGAQMFFLQQLIVPPNRFRPESQGAFGGAGASSGEKVYLHAHSAMLTKILNVNLALKDALLNQSSDEQALQQNSNRLNDATAKWIQLQDAVNTFVDSSMAQKTADKEQPGLRQLLEKKEGMFRMKMMGKRVNYGGRSVISPDPYITTDQIGVPVFMARKLTFPESVSLINAEKLRAMILNGPNQHPGANMIEDEETGQRTHLEALNYQQRRGHASLLNVGKKIVYRHLQTGDILLVNRQPTLHKPSIMAHIARILPKEQTIRMHYANCSSYNADFDGDEMNIHFPQSYIAGSEAYKIMATHKQYIVPTSGKPIRGLIQDSVVSGVYLTSKDTYLNKEQYQHLVYIGLRELIEENKLAKVFTLLPAIIKPESLWTGKQVISTILKNIVNQEQDYKANKLSGMNLDSKSKLPAKEWGPIGKEEGDVIIRDNELLQGILDKSQFGAAEFGMVHAFYEVYGSEKAGELLTSLARIFAVFLQFYGFSCSLDDLALTPEFNKLRRMLIEDSHKQGVETAAEFTGLQNFKAKSYNYSNRVVYQSKDKPVDKEIEKFTKMAIPKNPFEGKHVIQADDPIRIKLDEKMNSGEDPDKLEVEFDTKIKSKMNNATSQVIKLCLPDGLYKRFPKNKISAMVLSGAKGGLVNMTQISCMLGQQELEGRRVPKMQNGKTLPCFLPYDPNPRSSGYVTDRFMSGLRPQDFFFHCMAGREGLIDTAVKTSRSGYLQRCLVKQLESLIVNYDMTVRDSDGSIIQFQYGEDSIDVINTKYFEKFNFLESNFTSLITSYNGKEIMERVDQTAADKHRHQNKKQMQRILKDNPTISKERLKFLAGEPILSKLHPLKYFGAISEKMDDKLKDYLKNDAASRIIEKQGDYALKSKFKPIKGDTFKKMYYLKYMKSVVNPGENVGTIAAQSIGEPSTQMTLNTFHLAGHGAENMTLGVPRLKEILMTVPQHIKTPSMNVYFNEDCKLDKTQMEAFANKFKRLKFSDVVKEVKVNQSISQDEGGQFSRIYDVTLQFEDSSRLQQYLDIKFKKLIQIFSDQFVPLLMNETLKQLRKAASGPADNAEEETRTKASQAAISKAVRQKKGSSKKSKQTDEESEENFLDNEEELIKKQSVNQSKKGEDDDDEDEEMDEDFNMDIDGVQKKSRDVRGYEQEDEDDKELKRSLIRSAQNYQEENLDGPQDEDIAKYCNILREKFSRYFGYIRGIKYQQDKSASVQIGFPLEFKKVLMLEVAEAILSKVLIRSVPGIDKCLLITPSKQGEKPFIMVQGINFDAFYSFTDIVNVQKIETNDIWYVMKKYGVEAGRGNIVREIRTVFGMYGIEVNYRHLSLIADFITFNGEYRACNRIGMEEASSPFLKMSFETTMKYLIGSCLTKDTDDLSAPSSSVVLGQVPKVGTGLFDIIQSPQGINA